MKRLIALALLTSLAACGSVQRLRPQQGQSLPPKAEAATAVPQPPQLMTPTVQSRPPRIDDVLQRSQKRPKDPFDLPPS